MADLPIKPLGVGVPPVSMTDTEKLIFMHKQNDALTVLLCRKHQQRYDELDVANQNVKLAIVAIEKVEAELIERYNYIYGPRPYKEVTS